MAIAVNGGHVSRAIDFYNTTGKYFIVGGTTPWEDETTPPSPSIEDFKLVDVVALKKVENTHLVVPDEKGTIQYRDQNWRIVSPYFSTTVGSSGVTQGASVVPVNSISGIVVGDKLRINNLYEGKVTNINGLLVTLDKEAPMDIPSGSPVTGGAQIEAAKYVYVDCYLEYDKFPLVTYRQVGLCTNVTPDGADVLRSAAYNISGGVDEYTSLGILEILDNRAPSTRDISQRELISLIIEF